MNDRQNVFVCTGFTGHWPIGTAAVVVAWTSEEAAELLNTELRHLGLIGDATPDVMAEISVFTKRAFVLCDGDY